MNRLRTLLDKPYVKLFVLLIFLTITGAVAILSFLLREAETPINRTRSAYETITLNGFLVGSSSRQSTDSIVNVQYYLLTVQAGDSSLDMQASGQPPATSLTPLDTGETEIDVIPGTPVTVRGYMLNNRLQVQSITAESGQVLGLSAKAGSKAGPETLYSLTGRYIDIGLSPTPGPGKCGSATGMVYDSLNARSVLMTRTDNGTVTETFTENWPLSPAPTPGAFRFYNLAGGSYSLLGEVPGSLQYVCAYIPGQGSFTTPNVTVNLNANIAGAKYVWRRGPTLPPPTRTPTPSPPTPTQSPDVAPIGFHDEANCLASTGWSCDPNRYSQPLQIHFYADGPAGTGTFAGAVTADRPRESAVGANCGGYSSRGYSFTIPDNLKDNRIHTLYAYAINIDGQGQPAGSNPLLGSSPKNIHCSGGQVSYPPLNQNAIEEELVRQINIKRAELGRAAVTVNGQLRTAARWHSADMAYRNYFSHNAPPPPPGYNGFHGTTAGDRITNAGYPYRYYGEILARHSYTDPGITVSVAINLWRGSAPHWAVLTECQAVDVGCGYALAADGIHYFTCEFARSGPPPPICSASPTPPPNQSVSCCRVDNNGYLDLNYCPASCSACYGNIRCSVGGYQMCRWSYNPTSGNCQLSNCGMCRL